MNRPTGSNPWKYNQLPQHLKDFIEKEKGYGGETRNGVYIDPITSFNQMDRRSQDHLIMTMDQENLRRRQNEQRLAQVKADMDAIKNSPYQPSSSLSPTDFDYNALPAGNKYNYLSIPDWAKQYINPAMSLGNINGVQLSNPRAGLRSFDASDRANQDAALRAAGNLYAYDLAQGKIKAPTAPAVPQASPAQTPSVPSASSVSVVMPNQSAANPMSASVPAAPKQQAKAYMPSRMEGAVSKAASMGKMKSNQIDAQRQYDMRRTGQSQLVNQMGFPTPSGATTNQSISAYKNTNKPVPMPRKNTNSTLASSLV